MTSQLTIPLEFVSKSVSRAVLLSPNRGVGRELLRCLALREGGWVGLEVATPESFAHDRVAIDLAIEELTLVDELDRRAMIDEAIDVALEGGPPRFEELREGVGFRDSVANAVDALRLAGIGPDALRAARLEDREKRDALAEVLERYEAGLAEVRQVDIADVFRRAIANIPPGGEATEGRLRLSPYLRTRGLSGRFVRLLADHDADVSSWTSPAGLEIPAVIGRISSDDEPPGRPPRLAFLHAVADAPPLGPDDPAIELFAAGSPTDELREALRRAVAAGRRWDEIEIVATDPVAYGCALDALATRLGIPVTYAVGLPIERTRQGRAAAAYLTWIQEDFPAAILRQLLEAGDVRPPGDDAPWGDRLARRLRRLRVGWGRDRYRETIERRLRWLDEAPAEPEDDWRSAEEIAEQRARERAELETLRDLVDRVLAATPPVPDRLGRGAGRISPAALAEGLLAFLDFVPHRMPVEAEAHARLVDRLERITARLTRETAFGSALTILRSHLNLRVPSPGAEGPLPWSSAGGALHLSDLDHGGWTGRPMTFVVGLDAERFPGAGIQDPILLDEDRRRLDPEALPTSADRLAEARWSLAALLARLSGTVTLSYAAWSASEGREVAPAADLLQAFRLRECDPTLDYRAFHRAIAPVASPVPRAGGRLDASDVWLGALSDPEDAILLAGLPAVRRAFPRLDRGLVARAARESPAFTPFDGRIEPRPELLDPRRSGRVLSNSTLEALGACPLRYLYHKVLRVEKPDDPELDPGAWLESRHRGSLLHDVYQIALERARDRGIDLAAPASAPTSASAFSELALAVLHEQVDRYRGKVPVPSEVVLRDEVAGLEADVRSFVRMIRERPPDWIDVEKRFGYGRNAEPVELDVPGGRVQVCGRIDRVDREGDGGEGEKLVIVDYKTGSTYKYSARFGTWSGGRHLQHLVYSRVARLLYGREVSRMEYWFPTAKGENQRAAYPVEKLADGDRVLETLCETIAQGRFVPTEDANDCTYCDYKQICRVQVNQWRKMDSPPAAWGKEHGPSLEEYGLLRFVRGLDS
ncbi:MAG TPA: PD-(D/E)XK nuclease family protein [Gemmatimonadota bacterium]|nr:PD-(D/E)XK nuclease family protein [Gemmatimonadota bacterium]